MELSPSTQVLARNLDALEGARGGIINSPFGDALPLLNSHLPHAQIVSLHTDYAHFRVATKFFAVNPSTQVRFGIGIDVDLSDDALDWLVFYLPKGREHRELLLESATRVLSPNGRLLLVGHTRCGVRSSPKTLLKHFENVEKLDVARRCVLYRATHPRAFGPNDAEDEGIDAWVRRFEIRIGPTCITASSLPGVFCHGRLDNGTRLLLETLTPPKRGRVLDFGCGCGVVGAWLHAKSPRLTVEMVDSSALALEAARRTAQAAGLPTGSVYASDVFSDVRCRYDFIVSNPPFHSGIETDYRVVEKFLREAAAQLLPGGTLCIVANRFLPYAEPLHSVFAKVDVLADDGRFLVYQALKQS